MKSAYTGKPMQLIREERVLQFRKEDFTLLKHFFRCTDTGEEFETEEQLQLNLEQVYNQYRVKHQLPFPDEMTRIKEQYQLSSAKMSEILGFGPNTYRLYEQGEIPSLSNARLIQLAADPEEFEKLTDLCDELTEKERVKIKKRIREFAASEASSPFSGLAGYLFGTDLSPSLFRGYRRPELTKFNQMVAFFAQKIHPFKVKMCKLLFYADFAHFKRTGRSISGVSYIAIGMGPVPSNFDGLFNEARRQGFLHIEYQDFQNGGTGEQFLPGAAAFDKTVFNNSEFQVLQEVCTRFAESGTSEMIRMSHEEEAWKAGTAGNGLISYRHGFFLKYA